VATFQAGDSDFLSSRQPAKERSTSTEQQSTQRGSTKPESSSVGGNLSGATFRAMHLIVGAFTRRFRLLLRRWLIFSCHVLEFPAAGKECPLRWVLILPT
jgi:hypothetical protein